MKRVIVSLLLIIVVGSARLEAHAFLKRAEPAVGSAAEVLLAFDTINNELELYQEGLSRRPMVVGLNKVDLPAARENVPAVRRALERRGYHVYALSAVTGEGIRPLLEDHMAAHPGRTLPLEIDDYRDGTPRRPRSRQRV